MEFPNQAVILPDDLDGASNGKLTSEHLVVPSFPDQPGFPGRPNARLHRLASRAWNALAAEITKLFDLTVTCTSTVDAYRSYEVQEATFRLRYTTTVLSGRPSKLWQGQRWYLKPGMATAAVPGTSNHGWGLAVDACLWINQQIYPITQDKRMWEWLLDNAWRFGFSWELDSEPWHIRYFAGDVIPFAVLEYENPDEEDVMSQKPIWAIYKPTDEIAKQFPKWYKVLANGTVQHAQGPDAELNKYLGNPTFDIAGTDHARRLEELSKLNEPQGVPLG